MAQRKRWRTDPVVKSVYAELVDPADEPRFLGRKPGINASGNRPRNRAMRDALVE